jgi:hypothetical protein
MSDLFPAHIRDYGKSTETIQTVWEHWVLSRIMRKFREAIDVTVS